MALVNSVQGADARTLPPLSPSNFSDALISPWSSLTSLVPPAYVAKVDDEQENNKGMWCLVLMLICASIVVFLLIAWMRRYSTWRKMDEQRQNRKAFIKTWMVENRQRRAYVIKKRRYKRRLRLVVHRVQLAEKVLPRTTIKPPNVWWGIQCLLQYPVAVILMCFAGGWPLSVLSVSSVQVTPICLSHVMSSSKSAVKLLHPEGRLASWILRWARYLLVVAEVLILSYFLCCMRIWGGVKSWPCRE